MRKRPTREPEDLPTFDLAFHAERSPVPARDHWLPSAPMLNQMVADLQHSSAVRFSSSGFVCPVRTRGEFHVGALLMLPRVAQNAPRTTYDMSAPSLQPFPIVLSWFLHPRGELTSCCTEVREILRHVDCERGAAATQSCGTLRQNLQLSLRLLLVVSLTSSAVMGEFTGLHVSMPVHLCSSSTCFSLPSNSRPHSCQRTVRPR